VLQDVTGFIFHKIELILGKLNSFDVKSNVA